MFHSVCRATPLAQTMYSNEAVFLEAPGFYSTSILGGTFRKLATEFGFEKNERQTALDRVTDGRAGAGDFVWLSYNANGKAKTRPSSGTQLLAFNMRGAANLWERLSNTKPAHWDIVLLDLIKDEELAKNIRLSYVWPAIGGYARHHSTATPKKGDPDVECGWNKKHLRQGAGRYRDRGGNWRNRWIAGYSHQYEPKWIKEVDYDKKTWFTMQPPDLPVDTHNEFSDMHYMTRICEHRQWLCDGLWIGPRPEMFSRRAPECKKSKNKLRWMGKDKASRSEQPEDKGLSKDAALLVVAPEARLDKEGEGSPISRLAAEVAVDSLEYPYYDDPSGRLKTKRRANLSKYKLRCFTKDEAILHDDEKGSVNRSRNNFTFADAGVDQKKTFQIKRW